MEDVDFDNTHGVVFAGYSDGSTRIIPSSSWAAVHCLSPDDWHGACNSMIFAQYLTSLLLLFTVKTLDIGRQSVVTGFEDGTVVVSKLNID